MWKVVTHLKRTMPIAAMNSEIDAGGFSTLLSTLGY
jgi:hypothetical protein